MTEPRPFSVQPSIQGGEELSFSECIHVEALSPVDAAERALCEKLSLCGSPKQVRARVWKLGEDYQPVSVLLYRN